MDEDSNYSAPKTESSSFSPAKSVITFAQQPDALNAGGFLNLAAATMNVDFRQNGTYAGRLFDLMVAPYWRTQLNRIIKYQNAYTNAQIGDYFTNIVRAAILYKQIMQLRSYNGTNTNLLRYIGNVIDDTNEAVLKSLSAQLLNLSFIPSSLNKVINELAQISFNSSAHHPGIRFLSFIDGLGNGLSTITTPSQLRTMLTTALNALQDTSVFEIVNSMTKGVEQGRLNGVTQVDLRAMDYGRNHHVEQAILNFGFRGISNAPNVLDGNDRFVYLYDGTIDVLDSSLITVFDLGAAEWSPGFVIPATLLRYYDGAGWSDVGSPNTLLLAGGYRHDFVGQPSVSPTGVNRTLTTLDMASDDLVRLYSEVFNIEMID
jgi:hypothetical protein